MRIVSLKKRSEEEIAAIIEAFKAGSSMHSISGQFQVSEDTIYRIVQKHFGTFTDRSALKQGKVARLEKQLAEREKEIALLKAALKKY